MTPKQVLAKEKDDWKEAFATRSDDGLLVVFLKWVFGRSFWQSFAHGADGQALFA